MKVYVITQGIYSDYDIVFTTLDKSVAEDICERYNKGVGGLYREGYTYEIEVHELIEKIEDFYLRGEENCLRVEYDSDKRETRISNESIYELDDEMFFIRKGEKYRNRQKISYNYVIFIKANHSNLLNYEKIMAEKVAQIEYEIQNTFNGDIELFDKHRRGGKDEEGFLPPF
jgi:hypothetical protein